MGRTCASVRMLSTGSVSRSASDTERRGRDSAVSFLTYHAASLNALYVPCVMCPRAGVVRGRGLGPCRPSVCSVVRRPCVVGRSHKRLVTRLDDASCYILLDSRTTGAVWDCPAV